VLFNQGFLFLIITGVMLSISRSRLAITTQLFFLALNGCGIFFGIFYKVNTPDLYVNNAHHKIGWVATWVVTAQVAMSLLFAFSGRSKNEDAVVPAERTAFIPMSIESMAQHQQLHDLQGYKDARWSGDSGQGTICASPSQHSRDLSPSDSAQGRQEEARYQKPEVEDKDGDEDGEDEQELPQHPRFLRSTFLHKFLKRRLPSLFSQRALKVLESAYDGIDRAILILSFIALVTGAVTYAGVLVSATICDRVTFS
jgi:Domain of unknown function (DUF2427)